MKHLIGVIGLVVLAILLMGGALCTQCTVPQAVEMGEGHRLDAGAGEMLDSCISTHPLTLPSRSPERC